MATRNLYAHQLFFLLLLGRGLFSPTPAWGGSDGSPPPLSIGDGPAESLPGEPATPPLKRYRWLILPTLFWDNDDGFGFGARGEVQRLEKDRSPYKAALVIHASLSLRGYHHHRVHLDLPGLGRERRLRLTAKLAFRAWLNDGYWGIGNGTTREREYLVDFEADDPLRKRYRYSLIQPFAFLGARVRLKGPWHAFGSLVAKYSVVQPYPGSLLEEQQPSGMDGGLAVELQGGVLYDSREPEVSPDRGVLLEGSGRFTPGSLQGEGAFGGPFVSARAFAPLAPRLVLASRIMGEWLFGDVPFYDMVHWGGSVPIQGFGGFETLRGVSFGRWRAPGKAVANVELRIDAIHHRLLGSPMRWQWVPFADVGIVWGEGEDATAPSPQVPFHPAAGVGIRGIWNEAFVLRIDFGFAPDGVTEADGSITEEPGWGVYIVFDQPY